MSEEEQVETDAPKKGGKLFLIVSLVLGLGLGGGAFFAIYSGLLFAPSSPKIAEAEPKMPKEEVAFVQLEPMTVTVGKRAARQLRFRAQLEVDPDHSSDVVTLAPRIIDILNGYLRAVDLADLENPAALIRLRAQMLRRVQLVTGEGYVRDLLIMEFIFT